VKKDKRVRISLWQDWRFRLIWIGQTASIFGDRVTGIALPWLLLLQTHSAFDVGLISAMRYLPLVALGLVAGLVVDRMSRRWLMIMCDVGRATALGIVVLLGALHQTPPLWLLALVVLVLGTGQLGSQFAYRAWLPDVTGDEQLSHANSTLEASDAASTLSRPSLDGVIIQAVRPVLALGSDALSYVVSALTLMYVRDQAPSAVARYRAEQKRTPVRDLWAEVLEGVHLILTSRAQRLLKSISTALYLSSGALELLLATLTQIRLHLPPWEAGLVFGAAGVGGLLGSTLAPRFYEHGWRKSLGYTLTVAAFASAGLALASTLNAAWSFVVALSANLVLDGAVSLSFILTTTANALVTPRELRGRVNAATTIYSSLMRGFAVLAVGILTVNGNPLPMFILLTCSFVGAALIAVTRRI
jgi:MFS family permease